MPVCTGLLLAGSWNMARDPIDDWIDKAIEADPVEARR
jgi:hypothetical protein